MGKIQYLLIISLSLFVLIFASCSSNSFFEENKHIEGSWNKNDTLIFKVEIKDISIPYNFYVNIRNSTDYSYSNLFFFMNSIFPDGSLRRDTIECILANIEGKWLGKGFGGIKENNILLRKGIMFPQEGTYEFRIEQAMRVNEDEGLSGVKDIGIRIEK